MAVYQSKSNEVVWRDSDSHIEIFFFLIAFPKLGAGTDIRYDASIIENKNTSLFLDSVLFFKCTLKLKYSFLFNLKQRQKGSGCLP